MKKRVLMAMSGGIDSTVAAMLLLEQGYELEGVTFRSWDNISKACMEKETGCCSINSIIEAKTISEQLGFNHQILDIRKHFKDTVIDNFIEEYLSGRTPNPCVVCNSHIKWGEIIKKADELDCEYIATGHYAQIINENNRYFIRKGVDISKDQSYFLWNLSQENLRRTMFPLANLTKPQVREIAFKKGYVKLSKKRESQEICFIPDNNYRNFLNQNVPNFKNKFKAGNFVDTSGKVLGQHEGFPNYTIGQRKGLKIAVGHPLYVVKIIADTNTIVLGTRNELNNRVFFVEQPNFMKIANIEIEQEATVKIRYRNKGETARITQKQNTLKVEYYQDVDAITPGQSAVFYQNNDILGGGVISKVEY